MARLLDDEDALGTVQATVVQDADHLVAEVAWVAATAHQRPGDAREAATVMVNWIRRQGAVTIVAHVHPDQEASAALARRVGLVSTPAVKDGEIRWEG